MTIDNDVVYRGNTAEILGWQIAKQCIGVWDEASICEIYIDEIKENIT